MNVANLILVAVVVCQACGCASVGKAPGDLEGKAGMSIPQRMLDPEAKAICWSYENRDFGKRIRITLSGVTIYKNTIGRSGHSPRYFVNTRLAPGIYSVTLENVDSKRSDTMEFNSEITDDIHLDLGPDHHTIVVNTNGGFNWI